MSSIEKFIAKEHTRQQNTLNLIASENYPSPAARAALSSTVSSKYAEGTIGRRYYAGCTVVDQIEAACQKGIKKVFVPTEYTDSYEVCVQPHSGSLANLIVYHAFLQPGDTILSLSMAAGGHLSHGHKTSASSNLYKFEHYGVDRKTETIDYDRVRLLARGHRPKLIVAGGSAYPRATDFAQIKAIAVEVGALLLADIAHIAGPVAAGLHQNPLPYADIVTSTAHKTLRGPRGGAFIIHRSEHAAAINRAVMPGYQGGPHMHAITALAVAMQEVSTPAYKNYMKEVLACVQALVAELKQRGYSFVSNGSDTHLCVIHLARSGFPQRVHGKYAEELLEEVGIIANRNTVPFETKSPRFGSGVRFGLPALVTRGATVADMPLLAELIDNALHERKKTETKKRVKELAQRLKIPT